MIFYSVGFWDIALAIAQVFGVILLLVAVSGIILFLIEEMTQDISRLR